jgi:hypothetical protein
VENIRLRRIFAIPRETHCNQRGVRALVEAAGDQQERHGDAGGSDKTGMNVQ